MIQPIKIKVQPLTADALRPYGQTLENREPIFPEVEPGEGRVAIEMQHLKQRSDVKHIGQMAIHFSYNQTFIPLRGTMVLIVAPPPRNREAGQEAYELDYERLAAFVLEPGQAAFIEKGVWHNMYMLGTDCCHINVTRKNPGEGTTKDVNGRLEVTHSRRPYVEFVDIEKRDNRIIELDLGILEAVVAG
jgi:ureidoglycolate hydrolase